MKPFLLLTTPDIAFNPKVADYDPSMAPVPYQYADPYLGAVFAAYGPQASIQPPLGPQMIGVTVARVPLDLAEDGPIYVNAKQYHGILRRRQTRAKLEAQNKLVKTRKPYLHKSRHLHALNRVRGSGGRFLSAKQLGQVDPTVTTNGDSVSDSRHLHQKKDNLELESCQLGTDQSSASSTTCSDVTSVSNNDVIFRQPDHQFSGVSAHTNGDMQSSVGGKTHHCSSLFR